MSFTPEPHAPPTPAAHRPLVECLAFRRAPLLAATLWFAAGIAAAQLWRPPILLLLAIAFLSALAITALRSSLRLAMLPIAALWIVLGAWCSEMQQSFTAPPRQIELIRFADGLSRQVEGVVTQVRALPPQQSTEDPQDLSDWESPGTAATSSIDLDVHAIEQITPDLSRMVPISGGVRITAMDGAPPLHCGDIVSVPLRLRTPERYRDSGAWQYADYLLTQGIGVHAAVRGDKITRIRTMHPSLHCRIAAAQQWASARLTAFIQSRANRTVPLSLRLTTEDAAMLNAMLFGDRSRLQHTLRLGFERTGSFHLFVVSGLHVAVLAGALWWLFRRLRLPQLPATIATLALVTAYALLTGFAVPVQRALAMTAIVLCARLLSRRRNVLNALGAAALAVLVNSPHALLEASFQMTFLAVVAVAGIAVPLGEWSFLPWARATRHLDALWLDAAMHPALAQFRVLLRLFGDALAILFGRPARRAPALLARLLLWAAELTLIGLVVECCMALPMAIYFHRATVFALPANIFSIPLVAVLAPLGMMTFLASLLSSWLALVPAALTALFLHAITRIVGHLSALRTAEWRVPAPMLSIALAAAVCIALCCWIARRSRTWAIAAIPLLALIPVLALAPEPPLRQPGVLEVTSLDVGQGDSELIVSPTGSTMLVDAGGPVGIAGLHNATGPNAAFDIGEEVVSPYLWSRRMRRLDVVALTHAHSDHMGGMPAVLQNLHPRELWLSIDPNSSAFRALLNEAHALGITVRHFQAGEALPWGGLTIHVLAPEAAYTNPGSPVNNDSLVMRLDYGKGSVLLEGDAEAPSEQAMLTNARVQPVTLLKAGHHGSNTSSSSDFLAAAAAPRDAVISVGRNNTFGHPRAEVLQRFAQAHIHLFRTDEMGLTSFFITPEGKITTATPN